MRATFRQFQHLKRHANFWAIVLWFSLIFYYFIRDESLTIHPGSRDWPPFKVYYHRLPKYFNRDILNRTPQRMLNPLDMDYQFYLEVAYSKYIQKVGILTKNLDEADVIYTDYYPTYLTLSNTTFRNKLRSGKWFYLNLKKHGLLKNKNIFTIRTYPYHSKANRFIIGYKGSFETLNRTKYFIVPYLSNFSHYPSTKVNFSAPRKYSVFLSGSYRKQRQRIFDLMKQIKNSYPLIMRRSKIEQTKKQLYQVPYIMAQSKYCIVPHGDTPSSKRFYDSVIYGCIPVIISDGYDLPFDKTQVNWDKCVIRIPESEVDTLPYVIGNITESEYKFMYKALLKAKEFIRFDNGVHPTNGVGSILWEIYYLQQKLGWKDWLIHWYEIMRAEYDLKQLERWKI